MPRQVPDYSDKPTVVVGVDPQDDVVRSIQVSFEGWDNLPDQIRVIVRDWSAGSEPDVEGDLYEDVEV